MGIIHPGGGLPPKTFRNGFAISKQCTFAYVRNLIDGHSVFLPDAQSESQSEGWFLTLFSFFPFGKEIDAFWGGSSASPTS